MFKCISSSEKINSNSGFPFARVYTLGNGN